MEKVRQLNHLFEIIENKRKSWRVPLFIIGAGVSVNKVPLMDEIFQYFCDLNRLPSEIKLDALRLRNNKQYQSRATASNFFGILQISKEPDIKQAWAKFTKDFLEGKINKNSKEQHIHLWSQKYSKFHKMVASQVVRDYLPGVCLSLNYDGLTAKAIKDIARKRKNLKKLDTEQLELTYPCRILTTQEEIKQFYGRNSQASDFYPIIKLRGDIFNAICKTEGCRYHKKRLPIYEIPFTSETNNNTQNHREYQRQLLPLSTYEEVMKCRGCGIEREVEIDFPGYRTKELETNKIIEMMYRYVVPFLSCVVVCGVSGNWDYEVVEFLRVCAIERGLMIYCLDIAEPPLLQYHASWAISDITNKKVNFISIKVNFSKIDKKTRETI